MICLVTSVTDERTDRQAELKGGQNFAIGHTVLGIASRGKKKQR